MSDLIDKDVLLNSIYSDNPTDIMLYIAEFPSAVVRCKECKFWVSNWEGCRRNPSVEHWREEDFCNYGERRSE